MRSRGAAHFSTLLLACCWAAAPLRAQEHGYILGEEKGLQMIVHIFGEVARPGEYQVPDDTNVLQLVSKAGGPTEFSRLNDVTVTRAFAQPMVTSAGTDGHEAAAGPRILVVNLDEYLKSDRSATLPVLQPGDVVRVPRNKFSAWKSVAGILRDVSVIASAYFLGVRAFKN
jgi:protein involved in polysaccharide export with SLBB domain